MTMADPKDAPSAIVNASRPSGSWRIHLANLLGTRHGALGAGILIFLVIVALTAPFVAPYQPLDQTPLSLAPPSSKFLLGTDNIGHDLFSLILYGSRSSLLVGLGAALAALLLGGSIGILAGYFR